MLDKELYGGFTEEQLKKMMDDMMGKVMPQAPVSITPYGNLWCTRDAKGEVMAIFGEGYKNELEQAIKDEINKIG